MRLIAALVGLLLSANANIVGAKLVHQGMVQQGVSVALYDTLDMVFRQQEVPANPFDLEINAIFEHEASGDKRVSQLFFMGDNEWRVRFTGIREGQWKWRVDEVDESSIVAAPLSGTIQVVSQPNSKVSGFLGHQGNQYVLPDHMGVKKPYLFTAYMNYVEFPTENKSREDPALFLYRDPDRFSAYLDDAESAGFNIVFIGMGDPALWLTEASGLQQPRLETFAVLEQLILQAHQRGMRIHLWMWKDHQRKSTPLSLEGGINGVVDQRLQRYIAARLGPLPGWSMNYGFDLHEWVTSEQVNDWANYLHKYMAWDHLLAARGYRLVGKNKILSYDGFARDVELTTTNYGPKSYTEMLAIMNSNLQQPHLLEERHTYQRPKHNLDMNNSRRLLWWTAMVGGMGEFVGYYHPKHRGHYGDYPYPKPEQFKFWQSFWQKHISLQDEVCNDLSNGYGLCSDDQVIIYKTHAKKIKLNLTGRFSRFVVDAWDTVTGEKFELGERSASFREFRAPRSSDWVLVIKPSPGYSK